MSGLKEHLFDQQIFLFTPKGDILKMPLGSTPIDFAYRIHSDLGDHCVGARVNGRIVPINSALHTSDFVEIVTNKASFPSRDWLRFIKTTQARQHIRGYLREQEADALAITGEEKLNATIAKYNLAPLNKNEAEALLEDSRLPYNELDRALVAVGESSLQVFKLLKAIYPKFKVPETRATRIVKKKEETGLAILAGIRHDFAKCCKPKDGDPIIGYLGREHVIKVHRANCKRLTNLDKNRFIKLT
jgi:GTP pyrophosphokinase